MKYYLSDTEILNWNKRLDGSLYSVYPMSNIRNSHPHISVRQKSTSFNSPMGVDNFVSTLDPFINYNFSFSVAKNRSEFFFNLFDKVSGEVENKVIYVDQSNNEKITDVIFTDDVISEKEVIEHDIFDKTYLRYDYKFKGKLSSIMAYIMFLEDTINYFSEIFGYNEDGTEVNLLKFPIGTIVSKSKDKSKDYLVLEYKYKKQDGKYKIDYLISEMTNNGPIIKYGDVEVGYEGDLCYSRNSRIDDILNN
jgi:hypothetical protein